MKKNFLFVLLFIFIFISFDALSQEKYVIDPKFKSQDFFSEASSSDAYILSEHIDNSILVKFPTYTKGISSQSFICRIDSKGNLDTTFFADIKDARIYPININEEDISVFKDGKILISGNPKPIKLNGESNEVILLDKKGKMIKAGNILKKELKTFPSISNSSFFVAPVMLDKITGIFASSAHSNYLKQNTAKLRKFDVNFNEDLNFKFEGEYQYYKKVIELPDNKLIVVGIESSSGGTYEKAVINFVIEKYLANGQLDKLFKKIQFSKNNSNREGFDIIFSEELNKVLFLEYPYLAYAQVKEINDKGEEIVLFSTKLTLEGQFVVKYANKSFYFMDSENIYKTNSNGDLIGLLKTKNESQNYNITSLRDKNILHKNGEITMTGTYFFNGIKNYNQQFGHLFKLDDNLMPDRSYKSQQLRFTEIDMKINQKEEILLETIPKTDAFVFKGNGTLSEFAYFAQLSTSGEVKNLVSYSNRFLTNSGTIYTIEDGYKGSVRNFYLTVQDNVGNQFNRIINLTDSLGYNVPQI
jgi:hypothetical protein